MTGRKKQAFSKWIFVEWSASEKGWEGGREKQSERVWESEERNEKTGECCEIHLRANRVPFAFGNL